MNEQEEKIMNALVLIHRDFLELEQTHPCDLPDWVDAIHTLQRVIVGRIVRRDYPEIFATFKNQPESYKDKMIRKVNEVKMSRKRK